MQNWDVGALGVFIGPLDPCSQHQDTEWIRAERKVESFLFSSSPLEPVQLGTPPETSSNSRIPSIEAKPFPLFALPVELRLIIYEFCFPLIFRTSRPMTLHFCEHRPHCFDWPRRFDKSILAVCRQVRDEALPILEKLATKIRMPSLVEMLEMNPEVAADLFDVGNGQDFRRRSFLCKCVEIDELPLLMKPCRSLSVNLRAEYLYSDVAATLQCEFYRLLKTVEAWERNRSLRGMGWPFLVLIYNGFACTLGCMIQRYEAWIERKRQSIEAANNGQQSAELRYRSISMVEWKEACLQMESAELVAGYNGVS